MSKFLDEVAAANEDVGGEDLDFDLNEVNMQSASVATQHSVIDEVLTGPAPHTASMRDLTDMARDANAIDPRQDAGTRVRFMAYVGSILSYDDPPEDGLEGTVVTVKTGAGVTTSMDNNVFVLWDDGRFRAIQAEHLRLAGHSKQSASVRMVVSDLGDIASFFTPVASGGDELVHKSTKDLWAVKEDGGNFVIERLFSESGAPLKV